MASLTRSQSLRTPTSTSSRPAPPSSSVMTRSATRAAAAASSSTSSTTTTSIAAPATRSRPQSRTASPTIQTRPYSRTLSAGSTSSAASRTTTMTTTMTTTGARPPTRSLSTSLPSRPRTSAGTPAAGTTAREPPPRKDARHYPPSTALTRPPVAPRPRSSMGIASSPPSATRNPSQLARPRSSATNREPVPPSPTRATTTTTTTMTGLRRPASHTSTRTTGPPASPTVQSRTTAKAQQPPPRPPSLGLSRPARAQPPRPPSASAVLPTGGGASTPTKAPTPTPGVSRVRTGFSTVQRHYSPSGSPAPTPPPKPASTAAAAATATTTTKSLARPAPRMAPRPAPKPAALKTSASAQYLRTSTTPTTPSRSPVRSPANVPPPSEISRLQAELLQLYLLHDEAAATDAAWRASAKAKLGERFLRIREEAQSAAAKERAATERANVLALGRWAAGGSTSLDERIQALEAIVSGCWALSDPGGRHAAVVARFERWADGVAGVQEARARPEAALGNEDVLFVGALDDAWRRERDDLMQRLDAWKKQLDEIDDLDRHHDIDAGRGADGDHGHERSGLERMLEGARCLVADMAAELDMMGVIEREALQQEEDWIEAMNCQDDDGALRAGPAWRV